MANVAADFGELAAEFRRSASRFLDEMCPRRDVQDLHAEADAERGDASSARRGERGSSVVEDP